MMATVAAIFISLFLSPFAVASKSNHNNSSSYHYRAGFNHTISRGDSLQNFHLYGYWRSVGDARKEVVTIHACRTIGSAIAQNFKFNLITNISQRAKFEYIKINRRAKELRGRSAMLEKVFVYGDIVMALPRHHYAMFVDMSDVLFQVKADDIIQKFKHLAADFTARSGIQSPVIFNAEGNCYPYFLYNITDHVANPPYEENLCKLQEEEFLRLNYSHAGSRPRWLNSGVFMGKVSSLEHFLNRLVPIILRTLKIQPWHDDQALFSYYSSQILGNVGLDYESLLMASLMKNEHSFVYNATKMQWDNKFKADNPPVTFHFNGEKDHFCPFLNQTTFHPNRLHEVRDLLNHGVLFVDGEATQYADLCNVTQVLDMNYNCGLGDF